MAQPALNGKIRQEFGVFKQIIGRFGQKYYSAIFIDREITVDDLMEDIMVCVSTPPEGKESGEVVKSWSFPNEDEAINFIKKENLLL